MDKIWKLIIAVFLSLFLVATASAQTLWTGEVTLGEGKTVTNHVTLDEVPAEGLSYANISVTMNSSVGQIENITYPSWASLSKNSTLPASTIWFKVGDLSDQVIAGDTSVTLANIDIKALSEGNTTIQITVNSFQADNTYAEIKNSINTSSAVLTVPSGPPTVNDTQPQDSDGDGKYEDVDGDNDFTFGDIITFFQNFDKSEMQDYNQYYDFDGDGNVTFGDIVALFENL